jgi:hypothetical protein
VAELTRAPTSDEAVSGTWSGSAGSRYTVVADHPDATGSSELTHGTTAGNLTFGFSALNVPSGASVAAVRVDYYDYKTASQACNIGARLKVGGSYYNASTHNPGNGSANRALRTDSWTVNPATGVAWTVDDVNGAGAAPLQAFGWISTDASPTVVLASIQVRVEYTESAPTGTIAETQGEQSSTASGSAAVGGAAAEASGEQTEAVAGGVAVGGAVTELQAEQTEAAASGGLDPVEGALVEAVGEQVSAVSGSAVVGGGSAEAQTDQQEGLLGEVSIGGNLAETLNSQLEAVVGSEDLPAPPVLVEPRGSCMESFDFALRPWYRMADY